MKRLFSCLIVLLVVFFTLSSGIKADTDKVIDYVGVLSESDKQVASKLLDEVSRELGIDVVAVFTSEESELSVYEEAAEYYDYSGYDENGVILYVDFGSREYAVVSSGSVIDTYLNEKGVAYILDNYIGDELSDGDYLAAVESFVEGVRYVSINGTKPTMASSLKTSGLISAVVAGLFATGKTFAAKSKLKNRHSEEFAHNYIEPGSVDIRRSGDIFLYRSTSRVKVADSSASSRGGSTSFTSSSGRSHVGGSRGF